MKLILLFFLTLSTLFALSDQEEAEVQASNYNGHGDYQKTIEFTDEMIKKYPKSSELYTYRGTALFNTDKLEQARISFQQAIDLDQKNTVASDNIKQIDIQLNAKESKDIDKWVDFLKGGGLQFVMIFLGFLGGEIISRKYNRCSTINQKVISRFLKKDQLFNSVLNRIKFVLSDVLLSKKIFSFCMLLELLITFVIAASIIIIILLVQFLLDISYFADYEYMTKYQILYHVMLVACYSLIGIGIVRFMMYIRDFEEKPEYYTIELVEYLEKLVSEKSYLQFYKDLDQLLSTPMFTPELRTELLNYVKEDEVREIIESKLSKTII